MTDTIKRELDNLKKHRKTLKKQMDAVFSAAEKLKRARLVFEDALNTVDAEISLTHTYIANVEAAIKETEARMGQERKPAKKAKPDAAADLGRLSSGSLLAKEARFFDRTPLKGE